MAARRRAGSISPKTSWRLRVSKVDMLYATRCLLWWQCCFPLVSPRDGRQAEGRIVRGSLAGGEHAPRGLADRNPQRQHVDFDHVGDRRRHLLHAERGGTAAVHLSFERAVRVVFDWIN